MEARRPLVLALLWACACGSPSGSDAGALDAGASPDAGARTGPFRVLFDAAHKQTAGNAYWIVDSHMPDPVPATPANETSWSGGISSWGYELVASGRYQVHQLPAGTPLSYGAGGPGDLKNVDVFVSDEPEADFSAAEQSAMLAFARAGGGLFLISDHSGAVRCGSCVEAWRVINAFLSGTAGDAFGLVCDGNDVGTSGLTGTVAATPLGHVLSAGPFGSGTALTYHSGSTVSVVAGHGSPEVVVTSAAGGMLAMSALASGGRLVLLGDSSPTDDGTCQCSAALSNGWREGTDRFVLLNATAWLAHDGS